MATINLYPFAIGKNLGMVKISNKHADDMNTVMKSEDSKGKYTELTTLDKLFEPRKVWILKIDVEGMEEEVLEGAIEIIKKNHPIMMIEIIKSNRDNIEKFLEVNG